MPCGCDSWAASTVRNGVPGGNVLMISHPQAHMSATISQFLGLVRVGMLLRHVSVAPFPLALSVAAYNRLAKTGPELRTCLYVCDVDGLAGSVVGSRNLHLGTRETLSLFLVV